MPDAKSWAHLVGSVPLPDAETVFRTVSDAWGSHLRRISDGETGRRGRWIWFQREMLEQHPAMEPDLDEPPYALYQWDGQLLRETRVPALPFRRRSKRRQLPHRLRRGGPRVLRPVHPPSGRPGDTARRAVPGIAAHTHGHCVHVRQPIFPGRVPTRLRAVAIVRCGPAAGVGSPRPPVDPVGCVPGSAAVRGLFPAPASSTTRSRSSRNSGRSGLCTIPDTVDSRLPPMCYGSPRDEHLVMPKDMGILVEIANGIADGLSRRLDFVSTCPCPKTGRIAEVLPAIGWVCG